MDNFSCGVGEFPLGHGHSALGFDHSCCNMGIYHHHIYLHGDIGFHTCLSQLLVSVVIYRFLCINWSLIFIQCHLVDGTNFRFVTMSNLLINPESPILRLPQGWADGKKLQQLDVSKYLTFKLHSRLLLFASVRIIVEDDCVLILDANFGLQHIWEMAY